MIQLFFFQAFFSLITIGLILAFTLKYLVEKYLKNEELGYNRNQNVEFLYAFDIHCNSFIPLYFFSTIIQYIFLPLILTDSYFSTIISNSLYTIGVLYYFYVTLLGYYCKILI